MKILIFEWLNSGGLWLDGVEPDPDCAIQRQGLQMLSAIVEDFSLGGFEVTIPVDRRLIDTFDGAVKWEQSWDQRPVGENDPLDETLRAIADEVDFVLIIAPETEAILSRCLRWFEPIKHKLLNPNGGFTELASNKQKTFEHLRADRFESFPVGCNYQEYLNASINVERVPLPAVLKPIDGAGSDEVQLVDDWNIWTGNLSRDFDQYRIERFVPGVPVSVSALCGEAYELLTPTIQKFEHPFGHYVGAEYPIDKEISRRALKLAAAVLKRLPKTRGYVGLDLVIGESDGQPADNLIEVNPRLTTSYLRLREIYQEFHRENLAMRMLEKANEPLTDLPITCTFREPSL